MLYVESKWGTRAGFYCEAATGNTMHLFQKSHLRGIVSNLCKGIGQDNRRSHNELLDKELQALSAWLFCGKLLAPCAPLIWSRSCYFGLALIVWLQCKRMHQWLITGFLMKQLLKECFPVLEYTRVVISVTTAAARSTRVEFWRKATLRLHTCETENAEKTITSLI